MFLVSVPQSAVRCLDSRMPVYSMPTGRPQSLCTPGPVQTVCARVSLSLSSSACYSYGLPLRKAPEYPPTHLGRALQPIENNILVKIRTISESKMSGPRNIRLSIRSSCRRSRLRMSPSCSPRGVGPCRMKTPSTSSHVSTSSAFIPVSPWWTKWSSGA